MSAWQQDDESTAIRGFVEADWSTRPLFAPDSTLSLSEEQFKALSNAERQAKSGVICIPGLNEAAGTSVGRGWEKKARRGDGQLAET